MSKFQYIHLINDIPTDPTSIILGDDSDTYGVKRVDNDSIVVGIGKSLIRLSAGIFEYEFDDPSYDLEYEYALKVEYPPSTFNYIINQFEGLKLVEDANSIISRPDAEIYFYNRLWSRSWEEASDRAKEQSLVTASKIIKNLSLMPLTEYPQDIKDATCELAFALLDGIDPEKEFESLGMISQGYANIRSTYDRTRRMEHIECGVVSVRAWQLIRPYLDVSKELKISRV